MTTTTTTMMMMVMMMMMLWVISLFGLVFRRDQRLKPKKNFGLCYDLGEI